MHEVHEKVSPGWPTIFLYRIWKWEPVTERSGVTGGQTLTLRRVKNMKNSDFYTFLKNTKNHEKVVKKRQKRQKLTKSLLR